MSKDLSPFDMVCAARMGVYKRLPYFMKMLFKLAPVERPGIGTFFVDEKLRVHYDPDLVSASGVEHVATFLAHEVQHPLREHLARGKRFIADETGRWQACRSRLAQIHMGLAHSIGMFWNIVADLEINPTLDECGLKFPDGFSVFYPKTLDLPPAQFAEVYARMLFERAEKMPEPPKQPQPQEGDARHMEGSCGGCAGNRHGLEEGLDEENAPRGVTDTEVEIARRQVAHDTMEPTEDMRRLMSQYGIGNVPAGLVGWATAQLAPPEAPWQKILAPLVRRAVAYVRGRVDWKFGRPSRRRATLQQFLGDAAPLLPTLVSPVPHIGIIVDTSGSMGAKGKSNRTLLDEALSEVIGIVLAVGCPTWAAPVDAAVNDWTLVRSKRDADKLFRGGGGTDMRLGIRAAEEKKFDVIVLVTDGYTPWPTREEMPRRSRLVTCIVGDATAPDHIRPIVHVQKVAAKS